MRITVFTPAYNRGYIIENLYRSLQRQTFRDFEWVVIDDGSTDNTQELFTKWVSEENFFPIIYHKVENGGKHRAINRGVQMAKGDLFFIVDSDDYLTDNALELVITVEESIPAAERKAFAGVCGLRGFSAEKGVGSTFAGEYLDITSLERPKYDINGDKAEVFDTAVLRRYPFPEFEGENFVTEALVWDRIAHDGLKLRFFNEIIYICEYREDGLTAQGSNLFRKNPKGWATHIIQSYEYGKDSKRRRRWNIFLFYVNCHRTVDINEIRTTFSLSRWELFAILLLKSPRYFAGRLYHQLKHGK